MIQEGIPSQTLVKVGEDDAAFLMEKQLQCNTTEEQILKQTQRRQSVSIGRPVNKPKSSDRKMLIDIINDAPVDLPQQQQQQQQQPSSHPGRPGNKHRQIISDKKKLIGVINDAPVDPPQPQPSQQQQQQQQQQPSLHPGCPGNKAKKAQTESATVSTNGNEIPPLRSQGRKSGLARDMLLGPMLQGAMDMQLPASSGHPRNPNRQIGSDKKRLIGVMNDPPVDPPQPQPPQQQQWKQRQQHSISNKEPHDRNGERERANGSKPGERPRVQ